MIVIGVALVLTSVRFAVAVVVGVIADRAFRPASCSMLWF